ncbi:MAG: glycosyltransferase family 2 protein [Candidatus Saccharimonadales bacterium]
MRNIVSKSNQPLIYCVIPNWNGKDLLGQCLDSLLAQSHPVEVIVIDNGSTDGSTKFLTTNYPTVVSIQNDRNYGFTGGVNPGLQLALDEGADYVALFNNDAVAAPDWLQELVQTAQKHPKAGIITGKFMRLDKKHLDSTGDFYSIYGLPLPRGRNQLDKGQYDAQTVVFGATGGASLYRCDMLREIGLFDQDFFAYFEDVDISFRAQLAGWTVRFEPKALAYHHVGATSSHLGTFSLYHSSKNFSLLYARDMPAALFFKYLPLFWYQWFRWLATSTLRGHLWTYLKGNLRALSLLPQTIRMRRRTQSSRKVSVQYIDDLLYRARPPKPRHIEAGK